MNINIKRVVSLVVYIMLILCLFSCSVKEIFVDDNIVAETTSAYINSYNAVDNVAPAMRMSAKVTNSSFDMDYGQVEEVVSDERKIITNYNISGETKTFDQTYQTLQTEIKRLEGIIDNQSIDNHNISRDQKQKYLYMTVRIPVDKAEQFNIYLNNNINILRRSESQEDVTDNYNDIKLRIEILKEEQDRLYALFQKATTVDELVKIENRMSEIAYEIQRLEKRINGFDKKIDYSTFNINISEVVLYTEPANNLPSQDDLIIRFNENFKKCKLFIIGVGIYIFTHLPAIALCLIVILIILLILQLILNKTRYNNKKTKTKSINIENNKTQTNEIVNKTNATESKEKIIEINDKKLEQDNNTTKKLTIPKSTHYGDVAVRVMSDAEIEHDKHKKAIEDEKYNDAKKETENNNEENNKTTAQNTNSQEITDIKTLLEQKVDE